MKIKSIKILGLSFLFSSMYSIAGTANLDFKVKVEIHEKVCEINNNNPIDVKFGDMYISKIDGIAYETPIVYNLNCGDGDENPSLKLRFSNNVGAPFDNTLLKVNGGGNNVGILIRAAKNKLPLNQWVSFNYNSAPSLTATPVSSKTGGIADGEITSSALLEVEYE